MISTEPEGALVSCAVTRDRRNSDGAGFGSRARLRNVYSTHRWRPVRARLGPIQKRLEIVLQVLRILGPCLPVYARGPVFAGPVESLAQPVNVHQIGQGSESHLRRSFRQHRYPLLFRRYAARISRHSTYFPTTVPCSGAPLSSTGSARIAFPRFVGNIRALRLPAARSAALRCLRLAVPRERSAVFVSPAATERQAAGLELVTRYPPPGILPWRRQELPSSWGAPIPGCPCSQTPAGRNDPDHNRPLAWPPLEERRRRRRETDFRGSIAWLPGSLSTHHDAGYPNTAQDSLPGAGQALLDGLPTRRAPTKGFKLTSCSLSPFPKLAWHNPLLCSIVSEKIAPQETRNREEEPVLLRNVWNGSFTHKFRQGASFSGS